MYSMTTREISSPEPCLKTRLLILLLVIINHAKYIIGYFFLIRHHIIILFNFIALRLGGRWGGGKMTWGRLLISPFFRRIPFIILKACLYFTLYKYPHRNFNFCLSGHVGSRNDLSKWFYLWRTWNYIGLGEFKFSASRLSVLGSVSLEMAVVSHNSTGFCHRNRYISYGYP